VSTSKNGTQQFSVCVWRFRPQQNYYERDTKAQKMEENKVEGVKQKKKEQILGTNTFRQKRRKERRNIII
jgi:hypothetical protein